MKIFNLDEETFLSLAKQRVSLDALFVLERIHLGEGIERGNEKIAALLQTLQRKGYINGVETLTEAGLSLYTQLTNGEIIKVPKVALDIKGLGGIHKKLQDRIEELTGNKQIRPEINRKKYSFLCNETDLINRLGKVITKYKLTDFEKIEKTLLNYINKCHKENFYFPLIQYYVIKEIGNIDQSQLVTDMGNLEDKEITKKHAGETII